MPDEAAELLDTAIYKEIASQAFYIAGQDKTDDPGARALMKELAQEELRHAQWLEALKEKGLGDEGWHREKVANLLISEYLTGGDSL
ncbi:MAG: ferritin family protein, partial [Dehalococcoidales bacterium]